MQLGKKTKATRGALRQQMLQGHVPRGQDAWISAMEEKYAYVLLRDSYEDRIMDFLSHIRHGCSFALAAEKAGLTSSDPVQCPPAAKARIVIESFLERHGDQTLLRQFQMLFPQTSPGEIVSDAPWVKEALTNKNFLGRCWKMKTADEKVVRILHDHDRGTVTADVPNAMKDAKMHHLALQKTLALLQEGNLQVLEPMAAQKAGLRLEPARSGKAYLLALHCQSDSRVYGIYFSDTGEIVWQGIALDHKKWNKVINDFRHRK